MEENNNQFIDNHHVSEPVDAGDGTEKENNDDSVELMENPFDPTLIKIETKTPSLDTLIKRIARGTIQMDTTTYFQRKDDLWDKTKQSRLIESILIRFPLPAFFFDASNDDNWLIVDGLQRLSSIRNFAVKKTLKLINLEFLTHLNGYTWDDLPENLQRTIEEIQVVIYKIMPDTPSDVKYNIFKRINTGGLVLDPQEIRHAIYQGLPSQFIDELAKTDAFISATNNSIKTDRMQDRDYANRFLSFYLLGVENYGTKEYGQDIETFMNKAMFAIYDKTEEELSVIKKDFSEAMKLAEIIFGKEAFRKISWESSKTPPVNKALFDALSTQFALLTQNEKTKLKNKKIKLNKGLKNLLNEDMIFFTSVTNATGGRKRVLYRHATIKKLIQHIINN